MEGVIIYPAYACQFWGSTRKLVETVIDDEFVWNEEAGYYEPSDFSNEFEHTGEEYCVNCKKEWTGN